jgi:serine/threonine protein kinase
MGEVYRATDTRLKREVAVKVLSSRFNTDSTARQRFEREAHTASALNDPHICTIYDVGEHDGRQFLVMELLEGRTLKQYMDGRALPVEQALKLGTQIASALQTAHGKGIIHRDLKPANIFVTQKQIKVPTLAWQNYSRTPNGCNPFTGVDRTAGRPRHASLYGARAVARREHGCGH